MIRKGEIRVHKESGLRIRVVAAEWDQNKSDNWWTVEYPDHRSRRTSWKAPRSGIWESDIYEFFKAPTPHDLKKLHPAPGGESDDRTHPLDVLAAHGFSRADVEVIREALASEWVVGAPWLKPCQVCRPDLPRPPDA